MENKIIDFRKELAEIVARVADDTSIFSSPEYPKLAKRQKFLEDAIQADDVIVKLKNDRLQAEELASSDDEMAELAKAELTEIDERLATLEAKQVDMLIPKDPNDDKNRIYFS